MRITCVGGGPAGLLFAILARRLDPAPEVTVLERFAEGVTYGWGVVFWDGLLADLRAADPVVAERVAAGAFAWDDQVVHVQGQAPERIGSGGFGMGRHAMLDVLAGRAREVGVRLRFEHPVEDAATLDSADLVVACDGVSSRLRAARRGAFGTTVRPGRNKYVWLGTDRVFSSFTFPFVLSEGGWIWAHAYAFDESASTFIVETTPETWAALGFDALGTDATMRRIEELFAPWLDGHALRPQEGTGQGTPWLEFQAVTNERWHDGRLVLMGDAAHTTHFTIGSGTRLAMEDAIALAAELRGARSLDTALEAYGRRRRAELRAAQREARHSARWFETLDRYVGHAGGTRLTDLLVARRSSFLPWMPPGAYLRLVDVAERLPALSAPARLAVRGWRSISDGTGRR